MHDLVKHQNDIQISQPFLESDQNEIEIAVFIKWSEVAIFSVSLSFGVRPAFHWANTIYVSPKKSRKVRLWEEM